MLFKIQKLEKNYLSFGAWFSHGYQTVTKSFYILSAQVCIESYKHCAFKSEEIAKNIEKTHRNED